MTLLVALFACATGEVACEPLPEGAWTASGTCFGTARTFAVTSDAGTCVSALTGWAPAVGDEPTGATSAEAVTFDGGVLDGCEGTLAVDAVLGACPDGCAFELGRAP